MIVPRKKFGQRLAQAVYDFADRYQEKPGRLAREQQERQFQQRFVAQQEAEAAAQALRDEETTYRRGERERLEKQRAADGELRRWMGAEATRSLRPVPPPASVHGPDSFGGGNHLDPDAKIAEEENHKWDAFERQLPELSPEGARLAFQYLSDESAQRMASVRYGALARRAAQLTMPAKSPGGSEMPGLDPEDPEQAELLGKIQSAIDNQDDPQAIEDLIAELEGEQKRDRLQQIKREGKLGQMEEALGAFPSFATQDEIDAAHAIYLDMQRDQTRDPEDAWSEFRQQLFGGRSRWQTAFEEASKVTLKDPYTPRLPTEAEVYEAGAVLFPQDPRFRTDMGSFPRSPLSGDPGGPVPSALAGPMVPPPSPEVRAAQQKITPEVMESMGSAMDTAETPELADKALADIAKTAGVDPTQLPTWLLKTLLQRYERARQAGDVRRSTKTLGGKPAGVTAEQLAPQGEPAAAPTPRSMSLVGEASTEGMTHQAARPHMEEPAAEPVPAPEVEAAPAPAPEAKRRPKVNPLVAAGQAAIEAKRARGDVLIPDVLAGMAAQTKPKRWKRMEKAEQKSAEAALLAAAEKATRFDFHGALAPTLRKLGIDIGSIPKDVAQRLRDKLKKQSGKRRG